MIGPVVVSEGEIEYYLHTSHEILPVGFFDTDYQYFEPQEIPQEFNMFFQLSKVVDLFLPIEPFVVVYKPLRVFK